MSTPITKIESFKYNQGSFYLLALFLNTVYIMTYRIIGLSFGGSLPILILIIIMQTLFITSLSGFLTVFFRKKILRPILSVLMILQLIMGVSFSNIESMNSELLTTIVKKYSPDILISSTFRNYLIYNNLDSIKFNLILIMGISIGLYILSLLKLKGSGNYENTEA
jgi:ABC-2 type transport system permease protein